MSELKERRSPDILSLVSDIRVDMATINERTRNTAAAVQEIKESLSNSVSRGEYDAKYGELMQKVSDAETKANIAHDETLRRQGSDRVWKLVFTTALGILGSAEVWFHH